MSLKEILMPKLGESVTEGTINTWLVTEGDYVNKYDPIAEVMTDKVNAEVPSSYSGTIKELVVAEGETVAIDELICYIESDEAPEHKQDSNSKDQGRKNVVEEDEFLESSPITGEETYAKNRYSPAVLKLAAEHNIDLSTVKGSGLGGRIRRKDLLTLVEKGIKRDEAELTEQKAKTEFSPTSSVVESSGQDREIPVTGVRKLIADNMVRSKQEIPHAWMTVEVDVTDLVAFRERVKESFKEREGFSITYFAFFVSAVARALQEFPELNSTWAGDKIIQHSDINISIAVAKENELYVPVIRHADEKNIKGIAKSIDQLARKTHNGQLTERDVTGGTFTVNNTGTFGSVSSMGIINHPQAAILQVEAIVKRPVIIDDMFAARDIVNLSLSLDHRILDGLICGRFLARVKDILENMNENTIDL